MDRKQFLSTMQEIGWKKVGGDGSTAILVVQVSDRDLANFAQFFIYPESYGYQQDARVICYPVQDVANFIVQQKPSRGAWGLVQRRYDLLETRMPTKAWLQDCTRQMTLWAIGVDLQAALVEAASLKRGFRDTFVHIAALALLGKTAELENYAKLRRADQAFDLHPVVKLEHIERALFIAKSEHPNLRPGMALS